LPGTHPQPKNTGLKQHQGAEGREERKRNEERNSARKMTVTPPVPELEKRHEKNSEKDGSVPRGMDGDVEPIVGRRSS
jgi:hypothetical protein